jgi:predicted DNA-binding transcriptional regulator AlpA
MVEPHHNLSWMRDGPEDEIRIIKRGATAIDSIKRTFDQVMEIGRALAVIRKKAETLPQRKQAQQQQQQQQQRKQAQRHQKKKRKGDRLLTKQEVLDKTRVSYTNLWDLMRKNLFPRSIVGAGNRVLWFESEVDAYLAALPRTKLKGDAS